MRFVDVLYALPYMFFVIILTVVFGRSLVLIFLAIGAVGWLTMARIVRGQALALRQREFVEAAIALGLSPATIIARHIVPNLLGTVIVYATLTVPQVILFERCRNRSPAWAGWWRRARSKWSRRRGCCWCPRPCSPSCCCA